MQSETTILVMSCDAYRDLWHDFAVLKKKYWADCEYPTYLVTNNTECEEEGIKTICCGDDLNWTGRLLFALNTVKSKYVFLLLEDYYITNTVDSKTVRDVVEFIKDNNVKYYKLEERAWLDANYYNNSSYLKVIDDKVPYGISLVSSIWDVSFLQTILDGQDYPAWEFEVRRNQPNDISKGRNDLCLADSRNILQIEHMVQRGKYIRSAVKGVESRGDILTKKRGLLSPLMCLYLDFHIWLKNYPSVFSFMTKCYKFFGGKTVSEKYMEEINNNKYK